MLRAVVTGAAGFIGVYLVSELLQNGFQVTALCREGSPNNARLAGDVRIITTLDKLPNADIFYHLAWEGASGPGRKDASIQHKNAGFTMEALSKAKQIGCKRFIGFGTVYERLADQINASGKFSGPDFYVLSKAYSHNMTDKLAYMLDMEYAWCTVCHPIGRLIKQDQMMASIIASFIKRERPSIGPALTWYDVMSVKDTVLALRLLGQAEKLSGRDYYIGSGSPKPLKQWIIEARGVLGMIDADIGFGERPHDGLWFDKNWFDISPLKFDTDYAPRISFAEAVIDSAGWILEQLKL